MTFWLEVRSNRAGGKQKDLGTQSLCAVTLPALDVYLGLLLSDSIKPEHLSYSAQVSIISS